MEPREAEDLIADAVSVMDSLFGPRRSAEIISGRPVRRYKREDPAFTTYRILVKPFMEASGGRYTGPDACIGEAETAVSCAAANTPLDDAYRRMISAMRESRVGKGISTDGFTWIFAAGNLTEASLDLRPYYIEALDRKRFRVAVPAETEDLIIYSEIMGGSGNARRRIPVAPETREGTSAGDTPLSSGL